MKQQPPLVILGFDAADPDYLLRWANEGYLPTLAAILRRGCWAKTGGPEMIVEHGVWPQLFSGVSRGRVGYYYFRQLNSRSYDLRLTTGRDWDAPPFWAGLRGGEKKVAIFDAPELSPVPGLRGVQLANWAMHRGWVARDPAERPQTDPPGLLADVQQIFGPQLEILENSAADLAEDQRLFRLLLEQTARSGKLYRELLQRDRFDLVVMVFAPSHTASHQFWKYRPEAADPDTANGASELTDAIRAVYQAIDHEMGLVLAQMPAAANVIVLSSVGLRDDCPSGGLMEAFCRQLGYEVAPPFKPSLMSVARQIVPERWRVALSRGFSREQREQLLAQQFRGKTDWSKTTAFAIPSAYAGFVRVNLQGREPAGIVVPGREYAELLCRLETDLRQLVDPLTGAPAVHQVARTRELFGAAAHEALPDLFVLWKSTKQFRQKLLHPRAEITQQRPEWFRISDHSQNGFVAAAGPSIRAGGALGEIPLLDLAPTFLALLEEPVPAQLTGTVIPAFAPRHG